MVLHYQDHTPHRSIVRNSPHSHGNRQPSHLLQSSLPRNNRCNNHNCHMFHLLDNRNSCTVNNCSIFRIHRSSRIPAIRYTTVSSPDIASTRNNQSNDVAHNRTSHLHGRRTPGKLHARSIHYSNPAHFPRIRYKAFCFSFIIDSYVANCLSCPVLHS